MNDLQTVTEQNLRDTVFSAIGYSDEKQALVVYDSNSVLARLITDGYRAVLTNARWMDFDTVSPGDVRGAMDALAPGDLVVLVQSGSFRLNEFRFRLELFNRSLAVIEHPHLGRIPEKEHETFVDALAYDKNYYRTLGPKLKRQIDSAKQIIVRCPGTALVYDAPFESAKLNIGDYSGMKNIGGQFPIGEVFTEPADLSQVSGVVKLFAFGNDKFQVVVPDEPIEMEIKNGLVVNVKNPPAAFQSVLDQITAREPLWVRELGFGINRAMTKTRRLIDIGSYERMCGVHLSLGQKHTIYGKPGFPKRTSHFHVDVFVDVDAVEIDGQIIYQNNQYV